MSYRFIGNHERVINQQTMKSKGSEIKEVTGKEERTRRVTEGMATFGLLLLAIGLVAPFTDIDNTAMTKVFKWIFGTGAFVYTIARVAGSFAKSGSLHMRRLRRMESWAGIAFCVAAFFWFYNESFMPYGMNMPAMRDTVVFTLVGALIQIIASWLIVYRQKKESDNDYRHYKNGEKR